MVESTYTIGMKKGEKSGVNRVAQKLISAGQLDMSDIAEAIGLSIEQVETLKAEEKTKKL